MNLKDFYFTKGWTLFLDRDGVINRHVPDAYITRWEDFTFLEGVKEALASLSGVFGRIIVVSNQQGVGKGLMSMKSLKTIDSRMKEAVHIAGGRIDASYYCPHIESENHPDRKPGTGMGMKAKSDFPEIDFSRSIMVGDSLSDMEFGKSLGMVTVLLNRYEDQQDPELVDAQFDSLQKFTNTIKSKNNNQRPMTSDQ